MHQMGNLDQELANPRSTEYNLARPTGSLYFRMRTVHALDPRQQKFTDSLTFYSHRKSR